MPHVGQYNVIFIWYNPFHTAPMGEVQNAHERFVQVLLREVEHDIDVVRRELRSNFVSGRAPMLRGGQVRIAVALFGLSATINLRVVAAAG